ncbi:hypothetical protein BMW22_02160 [Rhizobium leguminosarum]|uniref:Recombinase family protein n=1 Tax=Rhizobium leguminosarum TaxID=384 RepID=A0A1L3Z4J5_RHILE|nr:recombinase family protein [Rhizobium leguminosarum]API50595.1 hypothetical protein BMW22_02160 [Rhizobium leguminosarum]
MTTKRRSKKSGVLREPLPKTGFRRASVDERRKRLEADTAVSISPAKETVAVIYCRVSDSKSVKSDLSIPDQEKQGLAKAAENGWTVANVYKELGVSAKTDQRPQFQKMLMLALSEQRPIQKIIVHSISRFARSVADYNSLTNQLYINGVEIVSLTQHFSNDTGGFIAETTSAVFDEYHIHRTSTDVIRVMTSMAKDGYAVGGVQPLGYKLEPDSINPRRKRVVINELERPLVERIFRLALYGDGDGPPMGTKAIINKLNREGELTRSGSRFSSNLLHTMLTNPIYMGRKIYNENAVAKRWSPVPPERVEIPVPAIIPQEEFDELQALLRSKNPRKGVGKARVLSSPMLLAGLAYCKCGAAMTLRTGTGKLGTVYRYYHCGRVSRQGFQDCSGPCIPQAQLDEVVAEAVISQVLQEDRLATILNVMREKISSAALQREGQAIAIRKELELSERAFRNLMTVIASTEALASEPLLLKKLAETEQDLTRNRNALKLLLSQVQPQTEITSERIKFFSQLVTQRLRDPNKVKMKAYLMSVVAKVEVGERYIKIVGRLADLQKYVADEANIATGETDGSTVRRYKRNWCTRQDSNL